MRVLVTGGAGFIGSHVSVALLRAGHEVVVVDHLGGSRERVIERIEELGGRTMKFYRVDLLNESGLGEVFAGERYDGVVHLAGLKAVGESWKDPLDYYWNNVGGTVALCRAMERSKNRVLVFSSSATVYGPMQEMPLGENARVEPTSPYGQSKRIAEEILVDLQKADPSWQMTILRYFNPVGAHESGRLGEDPRGVPNNLMPYLGRVANGQLPELPVYGNDYPTIDGSGVRDYLHVCDLAEAHLKALAGALSPGVRIFNLGTGRGASVLELAKIYEEVSGRKIPLKMMGRRAGDQAVCVADPRKAQTELGWRAQRGLEQMCDDSWRWQTQNPGGYQ